MKLGSLFDGIGGFPLSGARNGMTPVWASEIIPERVEITKKHFPGMKHLGDLTKINGAEIEPVDIISAGSPCQDLSVAGKREGLKGERSGLFMEFIRIVREMRNATANEYPRFVIWENVPGAFSSNKGQDFRAVIEEIAESEIPMPASGRWAKSGMVRGNGRSLAWRTLDAQYHGVPQRRKRIFLIADFAGQRAGEILLEQSRMSWDFEAGGEKREETTSNFRTGVDVASRIVLNDQGGSSISVDDNISPTLRAETHGNLPCVLDEPITFRDTVGTLRANAGAPKHESDWEQLICHAESRKAREEVAAGAGTGVENASYGLDSYNQTVSEEIINPIRSASGGDTKPMVLVAPFNTGQITSPQNGNKVEFGLPCHTLSANEHPPSAIISYGIQGSMIGRADKNGPHVTKDGQAAVERKPMYRVRRLTPLECERLQGFPDNWTAGHSDSARYRAIGDSLAIPCVEWIMGRVRTLFLPPDSKS